jgi:protein ImuA
MSAKAEIMARLQREIFSLQGFKPPADHVADTIGLEQINRSFPQKTFPLSALHEFFCTTEEEATASAGFISGLLSSILHSCGAAVWINTSGAIHPPGLTFFGVAPQQVIFLQLKKEKDVLWALEETLKCGAVAAVVGEMKDLNFTASRRFQLATEKSGVTCLVLRRNSKQGTTTAVTRWQITPLPSRLNDLPGVGYPRWKVHLLKVRNGQPGSWDIEWVNGRFRHVPPLGVVHQALQKKAG